MAEPWTEDFAALGERSAQNLASLASTRSLLHRPKESKMRYFLNRPLLALALLVGLVGVASGAAYVVDKLVIHVDDSGTAEEIEADINQQLEAAGVEGSAVVEKSGNLLSIGVQMVPGREVELEGVEGGYGMEVRIAAVGAPLGDDRMMAARRIATSADVIAAPLDQRAAKLVTLFHEAGFPKVTVNVTEPVISIEIDNTPVD